MYARFMSKNYFKKDRDKTLEKNQKESFLHKKSLGQNFLTSDVVPEWMCDAGEVTSGEKILEIGPGTGALTKILLSRGAIVTAVETDERAVAQLNEIFTNEIESGQLTIHYGDIREITLSQLNLNHHQFKIVANIPYFLSGFLFRLFLDNEIQPTSITFLIQKELAYRIARDKKESLLSLSVKVFGEPIYIKTVGKGHFFPKPKVDSAILTINDINQDNFKNLNKDVFFETIHLGLGKKRKQLLGNLSQKYNRDDLAEIFSKLNIKHDIRGEDLPLQIWLQLSTHLNNIK
jgi:16S rRNA (adenine1518-N6/adenine1519-N6)-dimethyltransferase